MRCSAAREARLTFLLDERDVDGRDGLASGATNVEDVGAHLTRGARQRRRDETECGARLHDGPRTSGTDRQAVIRRQVLGEKGL